MMGLIRLLKILSGRELSDWELKLVNTGKTMQILRGPIKIEYGTTPDGCPQTIEETYADLQSPVPVRRVVKTYTPDGRLKERSILVNGESPTELFYCPPGRFVGTRV